MQTELDGENLPVAVRILGVNGIGFESGNALMCEGRALPWLQDSSGQDVWNLWAVTYRDVVILDGGNVPIATFNLTTHDLGDPASYEELAGLLRAEANEGRSTE